MLNIRSFLPLFALTVLCNLGVACTTVAPMLNSERIKQKFGSYGIQTIASPSSSPRLSNLYSQDHGEQICRTFAITMFENPMSVPLLEGHRLVMDGQSIGSTFKDRGWALTKENLYIGTIEPNKCVLKFMHSHTSQPLALHVYRLFLSKGEFANLPYAVIAEIHHPDYLSLDEVKLIFGRARGHFDISQIEAALADLSC